jgi:hypothetical protein
MNIVYEINPSDVVALRRFHSAQRFRSEQEPRKEWSLAGLVSIAVGVVLLIFYIGAVRELLSERWSTDFLILTALLVGAAIVWLSERQSVGYRAFAGPTVRVSALPRGLLVDDRKSLNTFYWHSISRIESTSEHVFFYLDRKTAIIVPRRAFPDAKSFSEFVQAARSYLAGMGSGADIASDGITNSPRALAIVPARDNSEVFG